MGLPKPSNTRPRSCWPTSTRAASGRAITVSPNCRPPVSSKGMSSTLPSLKPTTCARTVRPLALRISQKSPTAVAGPSEAISRPTISETRPAHCTVSMSDKVEIRSFKSILNRYFRRLRASVRPRSISASWVSTEAVPRSPREVSKIALPGVSDPVWRRFRVQEESAISPAVPGSRLHRKERRAGGAFRAHSICRTPPSPARESPRDRWRSRDKARGARWRWRASRLRPRLRHARVFSKTRAPRSCRSDR